MCFSLPCFCDVPIAALASSLARPPNTVLNYRARQLAVGDPLIHLPESLRRWCLVRGGMRFAQLDFFDLDGTLVVDDAPLHTR